MKCDICHHLKKAHTPQGCVRCLEQKPNGDICYSYENLEDFKGLPMAKKDLVNHPDHYKSGGIEVIDFMKAKLTPEEFKGYLKGNTIKYLSRAGKKDDEIQDFKKAQWYLNKLVDTLEDIEALKPKGSRMA
jgi:hypothetical protein